MGFFKKKGDPSVIDLTDMQKRGLLSVPTPEKNDEGVVDFSSSQPTQPSSSAGDFLSNLADIGKSTENIQPSPGPIISSLRTARQKSLSYARIHELKLKLDDNDYK